MKKQIFIIILSTIISLNVLGQFKLDGGTNSLRLQTGGIDRMVIHQTTGKIGMGTTTPDTKLQVIGDDNDGTTATLKITSGAQNMLLDGNEIDALSDGLFLNNNSAGNVNLANGGGNVGMGISSPSTKLHIRGTSVSSTPIIGTILTVENNDNSYLTFLSASSSSSFRSGLVFGSTLGNSRGSLTYTPFNNQMNISTNNFTRIIVDGNGNVGIGATTPTAKLDIDGDIVVKKIIVTTTGAINALNRLSASSIYFTGTTPTINGIAGGVDGMILYVFTASSTTLVLANESPSASGVNRIATNTGANVTISGRGGATLIYDSESLLWRIIGVAN